MALVERVIKEEQEEEEEKKNTIAIDLELDRRYLLLLPLLPLLPPLLLRIEETRTYRMIVYPSLVVNNQYLVQVQILSIYIYTYIYTYLLSLYTILNPFFLLVVLIDFFDENTKSDEADNKYSKRGNK